MGVGGRVLVVLVLVAGALALASTCAASDWLPHQKGTSWTYAWSDSVYSPTPTKEKVSVKSTKGGAFTLAWATDGLDNPPDAVSSSGTVSFQDTTSGVVNTNWTSSPPPTSFPVLCAQATSCGNSLASVWFNVIWGTRVPTLLEPLIAGASWTSSGGYQNDVASSSDYVGTEKVSVPAFAHPVVAAKIRTDLSQAGALGDPYGSGVRDVWWVYGVGPVKIRFRHGGGTHAPVTTASLVGTTLVAKRPPSDVDYFPLTVGLNGKFRP
jgi:hypothetical protein